MTHVYQSIRRAVDKHIPAFEGKDTLIDGKIHQVFVFNVDLGSIEKFEEEEDPKPLKLSLDDEETSELIINDSHYDKMNRYLVHCIVNLKDPETEKILPVPIYNRANVCAGCFKVAGTKENHTVFKCWGCTRIFCHYDCIYKEGAHHEESCGADIRNLRIGGKVALRQFVNFGIIMPSHVKYTNYIRNMEIYKRQCRNCGVITGGKCIYCREPYCCRFCMKNHKAHLNCSETGLPPVMHECDHPDCTQLVTLKCTTCPLKWCSVEHIEKSFLHRECSEELYTTVPINICAKCNSVGEEKCKKCKSNCSVCLNETKKICRVCKEAFCSVKCRDSVKYHECMRALRKRRIEKKLCATCGEKTKKMCPCCHTRYCSLTCSKKDELHYIKREREISAGEAEEGASGTSERMSRLIL